MSDRYRIYTIPRCPWCSLLQQEFRTRGVGFDVIELAVGAERDGFKETHKISHFPQAFSPAGERIGGHAATLHYLEKGTDRETYPTAR